MNEIHASDRQASNANVVEGSSQQHPAANKHADRSMSGVNRVRRSPRKELVACYLAAGTFVACGLAGGANAAEPPTEFEEAAIYIEQNATDGDTEVVIEALGGDDGLRRLLIRTPDKRLVLLVSSTDPTIMGIREFAFESPEPEGDAILAAYPEGSYTLLGVSVTGERFKSTVTLSHLLPEPTVITYPIEDATVGAGALTIEWSAVPGVAEYLVEIENESTDPEQSLSINVPAGTTSFEVPTSLLIPGSDYQVGVATVGENGNIVFVETAFSTGNP
jgi:hypothetical protein